ncbi:MAG: response regulator transcription factor [Alphaproteobacteria bacterium]|nr:response regulator transcription factor [Alphaproteobacteria bacterium]
MAESGPYANGAKPTLLLADDHALYRRGVRGLLDEGLKGADFIEAAEFDGIVSALESGPGVDMALVDLHMPGMDGSATIEALRESFPRVKVLVVSGDDERETVLSCLSAGAHGYVSKTQPPDELIQAVKIVLGGQMYAPSFLARIPSSQAPSAAPGQFTPRQR